jgi:hypothetical protein
MIPSEEFLRHSAECEYMSRFSQDPASRVEWSRMAERWVRCAEFARKQDPSPHNSGNAKLHRKPAHA